MSANNLFSFLDVTPDNNDEGLLLEHTVERISDRSPTPTSSLKRKATSPKPQHPEQDGDHLADIELATNTTKRARLRSPDPVVLDDFETEAKREITASAGLTGTTTEVGSRLELRHQVGFPFHVNDLSERLLGPTSSRCSAWLPIYPTISTCSTRKT